MNSKTPKAGPSFVEFVIIISLMMSLTALSIDAMLPALPQIGSDLGVKNANDRQLIVSVIFLGLAIGQVFFGPLSDKTGRKPAVYAGYAIYIAGACISIFASSFPMMLGGRLLQGVGVSAPRSVILALVRDRYEGRAMAQVMSFVMTVFILVPMLAPTLGQAIMVFSNWRGIFVSFVLIALFSLAWFALRMPETLAPEHRAPFSLRRIINATFEIFKIRTAIGYTVSAGLVGGAFLGYLNSAQQIFQEQYALGERFPLIFAIIAFSLGLASFLNARLVMRYGMRFLVNWSLRIIFGLSAAAFGIAMFWAGQPPLWFPMAYLMLTFFSVGILFGNQNSLAMEPLGHLAGIGAAVVGSLSTLIQMPLGTIIGQSYNGTILPLILGIAILSGISLFVVRWAESK
ncbi:MAG: multidrug effflux MFS transporter [Anaerolineales bacterium]|nr:multidrug effflux MFS transporter [Chloroflexota bacterium]MBL6980883.1 multidrug effflux MFS transporter [Anaerolineales bacterium]